MMDSLIVSEVLSKGNYWSILGHYCSNPKRSDPFCVFRAFCVTHKTPRMASFSQEAPSKFSFLKLALFRLILTFFLCHGVIKSILFNI